MLALSSLSQLEHRNPDTLKKLQEAEKEKRRRMEEAYIDLDKCAEEKALGNQAFQECRWGHAGSPLSDLALRQRCARAR